MRRTARAIMLSPAQLRAARSLLKWTRGALAKKSGTHENTIKFFEAGLSDPKRSTLLKWRRALERGGVEFIDATAESGEGVKLRKAGAT